MLLFKVIYHKVVLLIAKRLIGRLDIGSVVTKRLIIIAIWFVLNAGYNGASRKLVCSQDIYSRF